MMGKNLDVNYFHLVASLAEGTERTLCIQMNMPALSVSQLSGNITLKCHLWKTSGTRRIRERNEELKDIFTYRKSMQAYL